MAPNNLASTIINEYVHTEKGIAVVKTVARLKAEHSPKYRDAHGNPLTFEAVISDYIRNYGLTPNKAINAAAIHHPGLQREYYDRLRVGAAADLDSVCEGHPL